MAGRGCEHGLGTDHGAKAVSTSGIAVRALVAEGAETRHDCSFRNAAAAGVARLLERQRQQPDTHASSVIGPIRKTTTDRSEKEGLKRFRGNAAIRLAGVCRTLIDTNSQNTTGRMAAPRFVKEWARWRPS